MTTYSHLEVEAALCVWEHLNEVTLSANSRVQREWVVLRESVGSAELRHASIEIGLWALQVHDLCAKHNPEFFDGVCYDWEVIPAIVDCCRDAAGVPLCYAPFPPVGATASLVVRWALFEDFTSHVRHAFNKTKLRPFAAFAAGHQDEIDQAFADGVEPEAFVARLVATATAEEILANA